MRIDNISISNYRNLDNVKVRFNLDTNYIVGENNLGKSNFLALLNTILNPSNELRFDKNKGAGAFLGHMINRYISAEESFLHQENVDRLLTHLNVYLRKIKSFNDLILVQT